MTETVTDKTDLVAKLREQASSFAQETDSDALARQRTEMRALMRDAAVALDALPRWGAVQDAVADNWHSDMEDVMEAVMRLIWPEGGWDRQRSTDSRIFAAVRAERERQDAHWGTPKDLPNGTGPLTWPLASVGSHLDDPAGEPHAGRDMCHTTAELLALAAQSSCDELTEAGYVTYADILTEEHLEALAESDPEKLFDELVQVAAVAQKWCRALIEHQGVQR